ncbi:MAG: JAB domain-containing protein, partial [Nannocystaceae bacterium]
VLSGPHARVRARAVLDAAGGLGGMARLSVEELARIEGVGRASARVLAASVELCRRFVRAEIEGRPSVTCPADVARLVRAQLVGAMAEHFMAVGLNARHRVVMFEVIAVGSLGHVDVHPRELFRRAVSTGVHSMVLAHNHPSGSPSPSDADVALTRRMVEVGALLGIPVLDHVIVASGGDASLAALGMMDVA